RHGPPPREAGAGRRARCLRQVARDDEARGEAAARRQTRGKHGARGRDMTPVGAGRRGGVARAGGVARGRAARAGCAGLLVAVAPALPAQARAQGEVTMSGSSVAQADLADLAYFYGRATPNAPRFTLVGGGTTIGITDAARGVVDAGMVSRNL